MKAHKTEHILSGEWSTFIRHTFDTRDLYQAYMDDLMIIRPSNSSRNNLIFSPKHGITGIDTKNTDTYPRI